MNDPTATQDPAVIRDDRVLMWRFALHCRGHGGQQGARAGCKVRFRERTLQKLLDVHRTFENRAAMAAEHVPRRWTCDAMGRIAEWPRMFP